MRKRSGYGWVELLLGVLFIGLGVFTIAKPIRAMGGMIALYGVGLLLVGIADIVFYVQLEWRGFGPIGALIAGILNILAGVMFLMNTRLGLIVVAVLLPVGLIAHCVSRLCNLAYVRLFGGSLPYWVCLVANTAGVIAGGVLLLRPFSSIRAASWLIGLYLILLGMGSVIAAVSRLGEQR